LKLVCDLGEFRLRNTRSFSAVTGGVATARGAIQAARQSAILLATFIIFVVC